MGFMALKEKQQKNGKISLLGTITKHYLHTITYEFTYSRRRPSYILKV